MYHRHYRLFALSLAIALLLNITMSTYPRPVGAITRQEIPRATIAQPEDFPVDCSRLDSTTIYLPLINQNNLLRSQQRRTAPQRFGFGELPPQTAHLGTTYTLSLPVDNPNNAPLAFRAEPLPLPANATFDTTTGLLTFAPDDDQIGDYAFTFHVTDGSESDSIEVTITVPPPDPTAAAALCGRILDANAAANGITRPLVGATVKLVEGDDSIQARTDRNGYFVLNGLLAGEQYLEYQGATAQPVDTYGAYRSKITLADNVTTVLERPIFIMALDQTGQTDIIAGQPTTLVNPSLDVTVQIAANTVQQDDGSTYTGKISISEVPADFTPSSLPDTLDPGMVLTVQPMGLTFAQPAPISFPNRDNLPAGSEVDLWSMDHETARFFIAGKGRVTDNGAMIITEEGGIREASWHFPMPPAPDGTIPGDGPHENKPSCANSCCVKGASLLHPSNGCVETSIVLPSYASVGESRGVTLNYFSDRAHPVPIVPFEATLPVRAAIPDVMQYQLETFGGLNSGFAAPVIWNKNSLDENQDEALRGAVSVNGAILETGIYPYSIRMTNQYGTSKVASTIDGNYLLVNEQTSPMGIGWDVAGLQRLYPQDNEDMLLVNGDGAAMRFSTANVLLDDDFDSEGPVGYNYSTFLNWRVTRGSIDLFGPDLADFYPGNGNYLDLDGTTGLAARLETQTDFLLIPGKYELSFTLGNTYFADNPLDSRNAENSVQVSLGSAYNRTFRLRGQSALQFVEESIDVSEPTSAKLVFDHAGGDYYGMVLDNVRLSRIQSKISSGTILTATLAVDGRTNIFGAGHRIEPGPGGGRSGLRPSGIHFAAGQGQVFRFPEVTGTISGWEGGCPTNPPDGGQNCNVATNVASYNGISGIHHLNRTMFLAGVFISNEIPFDPAPERLTFDIAQDFDSLSPKLNQTFFIGDGRTNSGQIQNFVAPRNATSLFLGFVETLNFNVDPPGLPGYYDDNGGSLLVNLSTQYEGADIESFLSPNGDYSILTRNADNTYTRRMKTGTEYRFNSAGLQTAMVDRNGNTTRYEYDDNDRLAKIIDPAGLETVFTYSGTRLQQIKDPMGRTTTIEHNGTGDLTKVTFPDGTSQQFGYDSRHLMTSETDRRGLQTTRQYDAYGRLVSANLPEGVNRSTTYAQKVGLVTDPAVGTTTNPAPIVRPDAAKTTLTDGENRTTTYTFGPIQSIASTLDPAGFTTTTIRDRNSNPTQTTYSSGQVFNQSFDSSGNLLTVHDSTLDGTTTIGYETLFNQPVEVTDPLGNTSTFTYDANGNLTLATTPLGRTISMSYESRGLPVTVVDPLGTQSTFSYNDNGLPTRIESGTGADARVTTLGYTAAGYLATLTDPLSRTYSYSYDDFGRATQETLPGGRTITYVYDGEGNLTTLTPPDRPAHSFTYDGLGQVTRYTPPTVNGVSNPVTTYAYNKAQQLTLVTRPDTREISYTYDDGGRLTSMTIPRGQNSYGYSATTGQLTTVNAPHANLSYSYNGELLTGVTMNGATNGLTDGTVTFAYDKNYRITQSTVDINGNGTPITYGYDNDDALTQAGDLTLEYDPESGLLTKTTLGASTDTWEYNAFGEPMRYTGSFDNGTKRSEYIITYTRDKLGRITQKVETVDGGTIINEAYGYDAAGRLAEVRQGGAVVATYTYDANNNRLTGPNVTNADYDNQDRLLRYGDTTYTYSANGELQVKTENGQSTVYTYDVLGNLTQVLLADGTKIDYLIDGQNRRVGKKVNDQLVYTLLYQDQLNPIAQIDANGTVTRFIYGSRVHVPDYMVRGTNRYRIVSDHLGSVRYVIDLESGEAVQENRYDAWGNVVGGYSHDFQPFGFAGGLYDVETGLVRFGARDYDASIGRWTTKDPIGFAGDDFNFYAYAFNLPTLIVDSSGLQSKPDCLPQKPRPVCNTDGENEGWEKDPGWSVAIFHSPADTCWRNGLQQCCYDTSGQLITHGPGAGTGDKCLGGTACHLFRDVVPTLWTPWYEYHKDPAWKPNRPPGVPENWGGSHEKPVSDYGFVERWDWIR